MSGSPVGLDGRLHHDDVLVDRDLDLAADARRGAEGDVAGAEDLLVLDQVAGEGRALVRADPELGEEGAALPRSAQDLEEARSRLAGGVGQRAALDRQPSRAPDRCPSEPIVPSTTSVPSPSS